VFVGTLIRVRDVCRGLQPRKSFKTRKAAWQQHYRGLFQTPIAAWATIRHRQARAG